VTQGTIHNIQYDRGLTQLLHAELHWLYVADLITYINSAGRFTSVLATKRQTTCLSCARRSPKLQNDSIFILTAATYSSCHGFSAGYIRPSRLYRGRSDNLNNSICKDLRDPDLNIATFRRTNLKALSGATRRNTSLRTVGLPPSPKPMGTLAWYPELKTRLGDHIFNVASPGNGLPVILSRFDTELTEFKQLLKTHLGLLRISDCFECAVYKLTYLLTFLSRDSERFMPSIR